MPMTINGVGTGVVKARGDVGFGSYDAMECFVVLFMPIVPYSAIHTFDWNGENYRRIPIAWSPGLVFQAYLQAWRWAFLLGGIVALGICAFEGLMVGAVISLFPLALFGLMTWLLRASSRRTCNIRRLIGPYPLGSCDPAQLVGEAQNAFHRNPQRAYGAPTFAEAVVVMLGQGRFSTAMWAARLSTVFEAPSRGEELTDEVLGHPDVQTALEEVRRNPGCWAEVMLSPEERAPPAPEPESY